MNSAAAAGGHRGGGSSSGGGDDAMSSNIQIHRTKTSRYRGIHNNQKFYILAHYTGPH